MSAVAFGSVSLRRAHQVHLRRSRGRSGLVRGRKTLRVPLDTRKRVGSQLSPDGSLMSVEVTVEDGAFHRGTAQRLFKSPATGYGCWDVSADGKRFLIAAAACGGE